MRARETDRPADGERASRAPARSAGSPVRAEGAAASAEGASDARGMSAQAVMALQRSAGNAAVA
ncbi:hypothetical protein ABZ831_29570, partial [Streptomyces sp. NPDC047123]